MTETFVELKTLALTALFNPVFLGLLLILFFAGRYFGKLTRRLNIWKILIVGYFALFLYGPVRDAGPILGGIFIAGILSNHIGTFFAVLGWTSSLGDILFALRYKSAYEDIRRREEELERREQALRDELRRQQRAKGQSEQQMRWQEDKRQRRGQGQQETGNKSQRDTGSSQRQQHTRSQPPPPQDDIRAKHLQTLGLKPGRRYSASEIKAAFRKKARQAHPDIGGSHDEFINVTRTWEWLQNA